MPGRTALLSLSLLLFSAEPAAAEWLPGGVPLGGGQGPLLCPDGAGGAYVTWNSDRNGDADVYAQHLTGTGAVAPGWSATGLAVCVLPETQGPESIVPDRQGGVFVTWIDYRNSATSPDVFAQRITAAGAIAPGWPLNGAPVTRAPRSQRFSVAAPDGAGGVFVAWQDGRRGRDTTDVYAQYLNATGTPVGGWPSDGLAICTASFFSAHPAIIPDDSGGAMITWSDSRRGVVDIYAQRVDSSAAIVPGWVPNGLSVMLDRGAPPVMVADGSGGALIACPIKDNDGFDLKYYVQRFTFSGAVAPGWPAGGLLVCSVPDIRAGLRAAPDARGGILLTWYDERDYYSAASDIYALRVLPDGSLPPGWTANGVRVTNLSDFEYYSDIAPDGSGGAYLCWRREGADGFFVLVQHLTAVGAVAPGWPPNGTGVGTSGQFDPRITADGRGGAIVAWEQYSRGIYAQRFVQDGIVPVLLALVSAKAEADRIVLAWYGAEAAQLNATVYRRTQGSEWQRLGTVTADGTGRLRFEDPAVRAGDRYAYRLGYMDVGTEVFTAETWVEVPAFRLTLEGARPNPAVSELNVSFILPAAAPAALELLDVSGRRVISREVGALGAGRHLLRLDQGTRVPPGLYWLKLSQSGRTLVARAAVVR
jgi:hypothetical protein